jgi:CRISPR-associated protein Cmr6
MHRVAFFDTAAGKLDLGGQRALLRWASSECLGQAEQLTADIARRRANAMAALQRQGMHFLRLHAEPEWRLAIGLGNKANAHEIGISLHGTYGWPVIPGSSLKGLAAAWAAASGADPDDVRRVLGSPRRDIAAADASASSAIISDATADRKDASSQPSAAGSRSDSDGNVPSAGRPSAALGTVCFLDAIPAGKPVNVIVDVLTPHVKPYYENNGDSAADSLVPPAEYHNPVPVNFLTVSGTYAVDLYGHDGNDVETAARWLTEAGEELGAGAKTASGYGYLAIGPAPESDLP